MMYIHFIVCALLMYLYIYSPILKSSPINLLHFPIFIFAFYYLYVTKRIRGYIRLFKTELRVMLCILMFSFLISLFHSGLHVLDFVIKDALLLLEVLLVPYFFVIFFRKIGNSFDHLLIVNAIIAGGISTVLLINPTWATIMKTQILMIPDTFNEHLDFRGFGFAGELSYSYPIVQAFCASFIICRMLKKQPWYYYVALLLIIISILVNARIGIIPICVAVFLLLFFTPLSQLLKMLIPIIALLFLFVLFYDPNSNSQLKQSVEWGLSFFDIMGDYFSGEEAENMDALSLTGTMAQLPHSLSAWFIGEGVNLLGNSSFKDYNSSDIGYCCRLIYGGIFYMLLWFLLWLQTFRRLILINKPIAVLFFCSILVLNWKGDFWGPTLCCRFFFMIYVFCIMNNEFLVMKSLNHR